MAHDLLDEEPLLNGHHAGAKAQYPESAITDSY